jgi:hypothetical protein
MGRGGAQRPFLCGNEPKKTGAYSAQALSVTKTNEIKKKHAKLILAVCNKISGFRTFKAFRV